MEQIQKGFVSRTKYVYKASRFFITIYSGTPRLLVGLMIASFFAIHNASMAHASTLTVNVADTISLNIALTSPERKFFVSDTSGSTVSVITDSGAGYSLGLSAYTSGSNALSGSAGTIPSITSTVTASNYANASYAASNNLNNTWGYSPSKYYNTSSETTIDNTGDNRVFFPAPIAVSTDNSMVDTLDITSGANSVANTYNVAIGARVDYNTAPGSYSNTFVFTVVANPMRYSINYYANGGSGTTAGQDVLEGNSIELSGNNFTRADYYFKGWGTSPNTTTVVYRAGQSITLAGDMDLYAVWEDSTSDTLYNMIASLNYGRTLTDTSTNGDSGSGLTSSAGVKARIAKDNSGVFIYDSSTFGVSSDAANTSTIYLYRGILDNNLDGTVDTYGSNGDSANYPNYVRLGDTCWRIVRTTGSGGVKMIYNGLYSGGTSTNSCANAQDNAAIGKQSFGLQGGSSRSNAWQYNINRVGYTFNDSSDINDKSTSTSVDTVFGSNANYASINTTDSNVKDYIENTWFTNIANYESILESSAGYCNDRTVYSSSSASSTPLNSVTPFSYSAMLFFGAYKRNLSTASITPTLACPSSRNMVDLYTTSSASDGNNQLNKPVALLTLDESTLMGSGSLSASSGANTSLDNYLFTGASFTLLSPTRRNNNGAQTGYVYTSADSIQVNFTYSIRPVISLKSGTKVASGSGTATSPWEIEEPKLYMQNATSADCGQVMYDRRGDSNYRAIGYTTATINGICWMTRNLDLPGGIELNQNNSNLNGSTTSYTLPASSTSGFSVSATISLYNSGSTTCRHDSPCYSYYTYDVATAGTGTSNGNNAPSDICPKGWRLPTNAEFTSLRNTYSSGSALTASPWLGVYAGVYTNSTFTGDGSQGAYWASTGKDSTYAYVLSYIGNALVGSRQRYDGLPIRCVAKS